MVEYLRQILGDQYQAALGTLGRCVELCPDDTWTAPVAELAFCQAVFHTLFYADLHLSTDLDAFRAQPFHQQNADYFRDYEELEDRPQTLLYDRPRTLAYVEHCHVKAVAVMASQTEETWQEPGGFPAYPCSRGELYIYSLRHIQHHAAMLSLRLRLNHDIGVRWVKGGWPGPA